MSFSDFLELELLDHVFGGADYARPATLHLALFTTAPNDAGAGGVEVSGGAYARLAVPNNATNWPAAAAGLKSNGTDLTWAAATANWGTVTFVGIYDAASAGNFLGGGALTVSQAVNTGNVFRILTGEFDVTLA